MDRPVPGCCEGRCGRRVREEEEGERTQIGRGDISGNRSEGAIVRDLPSPEGREGARARDKGGGEEMLPRHPLPRLHEENHFPAEEDVKNGTRHLNCQESKTRGSPMRSQKDNLPHDDGLKHPNPVEGKSPCSRHLEENFRPRSPEVEELGDDDFDDDYCPLPRTAIGRTILHETDPDLRTKKIQLQEMRNVVFGFPEIEPSSCDKPRERRAGVKSVSWGDEGATAVAGRREAVEVTIPRPIIKRSTSLPFGDKGEESGNSLRIPSLLMFPEDEKSRKLGNTRLKSPEPGGGYVECPVHNSPLDSPKKESGLGSEGESSGEEEFEERACRALSDFLVEATSLLEGLCKASGRSPEKLKKKIEEKEEKPATEDVAVTMPPLDAKEVLAALQTRLSDRHLMKSPPKSGKDSSEDGGSVPHPSFNPSRSTPPSSFNSKFSPYEGAFSRRLIMGEDGAYDTIRAPPGTYPGANRSQPSRLDSSSAAKSNCNVMGNGSRYSNPDRCGAVADDCSGANGDSRESSTNCPPGYRDSRWDSAAIDAWRARLQEEVSDHSPNGNSSSANPRSAAAGIQRSVSDHHVSKVGFIERPTSPDIFPSIARMNLGLRGNSGMEGRAPYLGNWSSPNVASYLRDEEPLESSIPQERSWRSSNALFPPSPLHPVPLRESLSDAAICSPKSSTGGCCLHGQELCQQETRIHHHHHHHHHHYTPFALQEWKNAFRKQPWWDQDEDNESLSALRGSAPQMSNSGANHSSPLGPYNRISHQKEAKASCLSGKDWNPKDVIHTPYASAPTSPYRSHPPSPLYHPDPHYPFPHTSIAQPHSHSVTNSTPHLSSYQNPLYQSSYSTPPHSPSHHTRSSAAPEVHMHPPLSPSRSVPPVVNGHPQVPSNLKHSSKFQQNPQQTSTSFSHSQSHPRQHPYSNSHEPYPYHGHHHLPPLRSYSPPFPPNHADLSWDDEMGVLREGLGPRAYLRHLVGVRKEVVAATRSCNPKVPTSAGVTSRPA